MFFSIPSVTLYAGSNAAAEWRKAFDGVWSAGQSLEEIPKSGHFKATSPELTLNGGLYRE